MKNLNKSITARLPVDAEIFPEDIAEAIHDRDEIIKFIMAIDARVAEVEFTQELIKQLQESLNEDEVTTRSCLGRGQFVRATLSNVVWVVEVINDNEFLGMLFTGETGTFLTHSILETLVIPATLNLEEALRILNDENGTEHGTT